MGFLRRLLAPPAGFEPVACRLGGGRSIHLSYGGPVVGSLLYPTPRRLSIRRNGTGLQFSPGKWGSIETTKGPRSGARPQRERSYYGNLQPSLLCGYQPGRPELSGHPRRGTAGRPGPQLYARRHIPGSRNLPPSPSWTRWGISCRTTTSPSSSAPTAGTSAKATDRLKAMGYTQVHNIGGHEAVPRQPGLPGAGGGHRLGPSGA